MKCKHCGAGMTRFYNEDRLAKMDEQQACFDCSYWLEQADSRDRALVDGDFVHRRHNGMVYPRGQGSGGAHHTIVMTDGSTIETNDLWHQGVIPMHMRHLFAINVQSIRRD